MLTVHSSWRLATGTPLCTLMEVSNDVCFATWRGRRSFIKQARACFDPSSISIFYLVFTGGHFNQEVDQLPPNLEHLTVGENFDQVLEQLPPKLQFLAFNRTMNIPKDIFNLSVKNIGMQCNTMIPRVVNGLISKQCPSAYTLA